MRPLNQRAAGEQLRGTRSQADRERADARGSREEQAAIKVTCDGCGHPAIVSDAAAGKRGKCRQCGAGVSVPRTGGFLACKIGEYDVAPSPIQVVDKADAGPQFNVNSSTLSRDF